MPRAHVRPTSFARVAVLALVTTVLPLGAAFAQPARLVRVAHDDIEIRSTQRTKGDVIMRASRGAVFEVIHTEGDRFTHRKSNWYWVLLPRDAWGTQRAGWISGREIDEVIREEAATDRAAPEKLAAAQALAEPRVAGPAAPHTAEPQPAPIEQPESESDVILNFEFAKTDLTADARDKLNDAVSHLKANATMSLAVEGHADAIGSDAFNKRLGLARAETVKRYLAEHAVPADQIGVISYGETQPAASNDTELGRALNRRVVIKVGR